MIWFSGHESLIAWLSRCFRKLSFQWNSPTLLYLKKSSWNQHRRSCSCGYVRIDCDLNSWIALWCSLVCSHRCLPGLLAYWSAKSTSFARNQPARSWSVSDNSLTWIVQNFQIVRLCTVYQLFSVVCYSWSQSQIFHMWLWKADVSQFVNILIISLIRRSHKEAIVIRSAYAG